ncbi:hypothetical protein GCM10010869_63250 [Mesorhizobium tianshanense]|nr:hypothetical protein GCM10010869_63250 [Mesorhizobium tianshanense]
MGIVSKIALRAPSEFFVDLIGNHASFRTRQFSENSGEIADTSAHLKDGLARSYVQMVENKCPKRRQSAVQSALFVKRDQNVVVNLMKCGCRARMDCPDLQPRMDTPWAFTEIFLARDFGEGVYDSRVMHNG